MDTTTPRFDEAPTAAQAAEAEAQRQLAGEVDAANPRLADIWHRKTLDALAQADAGQLVDDEDMQVWLANLGTDPEVPPPQSA